MGCETSAPVTSVTPDRVAEAQNRLHKFADDPHALVRDRADYLVRAVSRMERAWATSDPGHQGDLWKTTVLAAARLRDALEREVDPLSGTCQAQWLDQLDNCWDRCGLPKDHPGHHLAAYMVKKGHDE